MNTIIKMIEAFKPETFMSYDVSVDKLMQKFHISFSEAHVLHVLLKEYKASNKDFGVKSGRHHIAKLRTKLHPATQNEEIPIILSLGMGFYMISDYDKKMIRNFLEKE